MHWRLKRMKRPNHHAETTKTILHGDPFIKDYIYKLVTAASEI